VDAAWVEQEGSIAYLDVRAMRVAEDDDVRAREAPLQKTWQR
jgi:hypothetical protein